MACAVCDLLRTSADCTWLKPEELPNKDLLIADQKLLDCESVNQEFFNYPGDNAKVLDRLVLERENFESTSPHRLRVCSTCHSDLKKNLTPKAAKANGFWFGDFPEELKEANWVEMMASTAVRMAGTVVAMQEFKVRGVPRSAKTLMRGSFTFYMQDSCTIAQCLPLCDTDIAGSIACALVGCRPTEGQLRRLFGARKNMVEAIFNFLLDKNNRLVGVHDLVREAHESDENLNTYFEDGSIPKAIRDALFPVADRGNVVANSHSTHAHGNLEPETAASCEGMDSNADGGDSETESQREEEQGVAPHPCVISTRAVMQTGEDLARSDALKSTRLGILRETMSERSAGVVSDNAVTASLARQRNAEQAARAGRTPPVLPANALVVTHTGQLLEDFYDNRLFPGAFPDLFPHACGGHLDERRRSITFDDFCRITMLQRDDRFRRHKSYLFCLCAMLFKREAIKNARFKLSGRVSSRTASLLASITPEDLAAAAKEMEQGTGTWSVLSNRPAVRELITSMQSVHAGTDWSIYNKKTTRMIAISFNVQCGQPFWWLTFSPSDNNSPIVLKMAGIDVDVTSRLKADYPDYVKRLQVVASDHVASAFFYHSVTDAVFRCLLRFGAKDSDGGVLGRVKVSHGLEPFGASHVK